MFISYPLRLSRCQRYDFRLGNRKGGKRFVKEINKEGEDKYTSGCLDIVVQNAKGSYRDALSTLDVVYTGTRKGKVGNNY